MSASRCAFCRASRSKVASAPRATTRSASTGATTIEDAAAGLACLLREGTALALGHEALGGLHGHGGVAAVGVGADRVRELLVERRAADQHDIVIAHTLLDQGVDDDLHVGHGRRQ